MKKYFVGVLFLLSACGTSKRHADSSVNRGDSTDRPAVIDTTPLGRLTAAKTFLKAGKGYESIAILEEEKKHGLNASDDSRLILYYLGRSFEHVGRWDDAIKNYRELLSLSLKADPRDQAEILYRLVFCYEATGNDTQVLSTLKDLERRRRYLPKEVVDVEIPARYAKVFTRRGDLKNAQVYLSRFQSALKKANQPTKVATTKNATSQEVADDLTLKQTTPLFSPDVNSQIRVPRLMYNIGQLSMRRVTDEELLKGHAALAQSQPFLFQAIQSDDPEWAPKAREDLIRAYEEALAVIAAVPAEPTEDPIVGLSQQQETRKAMASELSRLTVDLEEIKNKNKEPLSKEATSLFSKMETLEARIDEIVNARPVHEGLTEEAQQLEGIKREGKIVDPPPATLPKKKTQ